MNNWGGGGPGPNDQPLFPRQLEAWKQAVNGAGLQDFLSDKDEATKRDIIRDIYEFLHAQQLSAMSSHMQQMSENLQKLQQTTQDQSSLGGGFVIFCLGLGLGAAGMFFFGHRFFEK
jgi:hypothetical protein